MTDPKVIQIQKKSRTWRKVGPNLFLHIPSGTYYIRKWKAGRALYKSTGQTTKMRAMAVAEEMLVEWLGLKSTGRRVRVREVCQEFERELGRRANAGERRASTRAKDKWYLPRISSLFGGYFIDQIDEDLVETWLTGEGRELGISLFDVVKYLSALLKFAHRRKLINRKPSLSMPKTKSVRRRYTDEELESFRVHSDGDLRDLIVLISENPMRPWEVKHLRWDQIDLGKSEVVISLKVEHKKNKRSRSFVVSEAGANLLRKRKKDSRSEYVFPAPADPKRPVSDVRVGRWWRAMLDRAGLPSSYRFHWLRHTFYSRAILEAGISADQVGQAGGTSPQTLSRNYLMQTLEETKRVTSAVKFENTGEKLVKKSGNEL